MDPFAFERLCQRVLRESGFEEVKSVEMLIKFEIYLNDVLSTNQTFISKLSEDEIKNMNLSLAELHKKYKNHQTEL